VFVTKQTFWPTLARYLKKKQNAPATMPSEKDTGKSVEPVQQSLRELAAKSWNMELIISGAATVVTSTLPGAVDVLFNDYLHQISPGDPSAYGGLPVLAYAFLKVMTWILYGAFFIHLSIRGFWIGLIGLSVIYPEGIDYDNVPNVTKSQQQQYRKTYGPLEAYIHRLDRFCNQIFALAFMAALMSTGIAFCYMIMFGATFVSENFVPAEYRRYTQFFFPALVITLAIAVLIGNHLGKKHEALGEKFAPFLNAVHKGSQTVFMPFVHKPLNYVMLTFSSNVKRRTYYIAFALFFTAIMIASLWTMIHKMGDLRGRNIGELRDHYGTGTARTEIFDAKYDELRKETDIFPAVSMPAQVNEGAFVPIFVAFPLHLDNRMEKICPLPTLPDSLDKRQRRLVGDSLRIGCVGRFFRVTLNDSIALQPAWMFRKKDGNQGFQAFLPGKILQEGKNILTVRIPSIAKSDSLEIYGEVPFWYSL
jgi:hypothetical protein